MSRSQLLVFLGVLFVTSTLRAQVPEIRVHVEQVDPSRYPLVDVYFRVMDTNPASGFKPLSAAGVNVQLRDGPAAGPLRLVAELDENNFAQPIARSLAICFAIDRSGSVSAVIERIGQAIDDYAQVMAAEQPPAPAQPDICGLNAFAGHASGRDIKRLGFTSAFPPVDDFSDRHLQTTLGGTPLYQALLIVMNETAVQPYENRAIILVSDGKQAGANPPGYTSMGKIACAEAIGDLMRSLKVPIFTMGFSKIQQTAGGFVTTAGGVARNVMMPLASKTGGSYFEPNSPVPEVPDLPPVADRDKDVPGGVPENACRTWIASSLSLAKNTAADKGEFGDLPPEIAKLADITLGVTPTTYEYLEAAYEYGIPQPQNLDRITWNDLAGAKVEMETLVSRPLTSADLDRIYRDQVINMFRKIRQSLKNLYRVTYRVETPAYDGAARKAEVTVGYTTRINSIDTYITAKGESPYSNPLVMSEDIPRSFTVPLDASNPTMDIITAADPPRGNDWDGPLAYRSSSGIVMEVEAPGGEKSVHRVAERTFDGEYRILERDPARPDDTGHPVTRMTAEERADILYYLRTVQHELDLDDSPPSLTGRMSMRTPGVVKHQSLLRPLNNTADDAAKKLLGFYLAGEFHRSYSFDADVPDPAGPGGMTRQRFTLTARFPTPPVVFYVDDKTPPTMRLELGTDADGDSHLEATEDPLDRAVASTASPMSYRVSGNSFLDPGSGEVALLAPPDGLGLQLANGRFSEGLRVHVNERLRIRVLAKDNFDRNHNHAYLERPDLTPQSNDYETDAIGSPAALSNSPPFLQQRPFDEVGKIVDGRHQSGVSWRFLVGGVPQFELEQGVVFRSANVPGGEDIFLEVVACDEAGNFLGPAAPGGGATSVLIPVLVVPTEMSFDVLVKESRKK